MDSPFQHEDGRQFGCTEFEALLADALDLALDTGKRVEFQAHQQACSHCQALFAEAEAGKRWLGALKSEVVELPPGLLGAILHATTGAEQPAGKPWWQRLREVPGLAPVFQVVLQPRFAMSFAMAFFSVTAILGITGVRLRSLRAADLRPSAIARTVYVAEGKVVKYYENIRLVYEIESRVRDLKRVLPEETTPKPDPSKERNRSVQPDQNRYRDYTQEEVGPMLSLLSHPSVHAISSTQRERRRYL
jgi:hypothetical protein